MSRFLKHTLRCVVFLAVLALLLTGVSQLVRPKNNTRSDGMPCTPPCICSGQ